MARPPAPANFYRPDGYTADESVGYLMKRVLGVICPGADERLEPAA